MVHISEIEARLSQLGVKLSRWFVPELRELQHVLVDHERIIAAVPGRYFGGYALLVATDQRLLLIDKRSFFLTLEDIRYDMISQIDFNSRMLESTLHIYTVNKQHRFATYKYRKQLRDLTVYVQRQILLMRQQYQESGQPPAFQSLMNRTQPPPLREVYPSRAVAVSHPYMRFSAPVRNFKKLGSAALIGAHRMHTHVHLPHHLPSIPYAEPQAAPTAYYQ